MTRLPAAIPANPSSLTKASVSHAAISRSFVWSLSALVARSRTVRHWTGTPASAEGS